MALYATTANRGAQWQDSGYFILRTVTGETVNPLGLALTHPLHYWISRLAIRMTWFEPAFAVTLVSSLAAALAVANLFGCVVSLTGNRIAALLVAASMAIANTFWQLATIAETYTLTAALLTAQCWCMILIEKSVTNHKAEDSAIAAGPLQRFRTQDLAFLGMFFFNGLSLANHNLALLTAPMLLVAALWGVGRGRIPMRFFFIGIALWAIGSLPYSALVVEEASRSGEWRNSLHSALFGRSFGEKVLSVSISGRLLLISGGFVLLNFPNLLLPAAFHGLRGVWQKGSDAWLYRLLFLGLVVHALFAFRYPVPDQHYFFIPTYIFLCLFAGAGFARWSTLPSGSDGPRLQNRRALFSNKVVVLAFALILATPVAYAMVPALARQFNALEFFKRNKPYRDDYAYLFLPWSVSERSADKMSREAVELAGDSGIIIVEDHMAEFAVRYQVHRASLGNIAVVAEMAPQDFEAAAASGRPIVLVPSNADRPMTHSLTGTWLRCGDLYVLDPG